MSARHAEDSEVRLYDRLFDHPDPAGQKSHDFKEFLNPESLTILNFCKIEPSLSEAKPLDKFQFQRIGYFCVDKDSIPGSIIFNRTVPLRDPWGKVVKK